MRRVTSLSQAVAVLSILGGTLSAHGGSHLWRFSEVFTNADGTIQFIELKECCGSTGEVFMTGKRVFSEANNNVATFQSNLTGSTAYKYLLLGTAGFAALPGAPAPDLIIPSNFFPVGLANTLQYDVYNEAYMTYAAGALPTDGITSLRIDGSTGMNTPTNFAGQSGTVNAAPCNDADSDGYGSPGSPQCPAGPQTDCNDADSAINPGAAEACFDGVDNDCDNATDCDDTTCASLLACIPTMSQWGLAILALAVATGGTIVLRRQNAMH